MKTISTFFVILGFFSSLLSCYAVDARVSVTRIGNEFAYTLHNDETAGSALRLFVFHLVVDAPCEVVSTPAGWTASTDNHSYIDWYCDAGSLAFHISPGDSVSGFVVKGGTSQSETLPYAVSSWNHQTAVAGPSLIAGIEAPTVLKVEADIVSLSKTDTEFRFELIGIPSYSYQIESSPDLLTWSPVLTAVSPFTFIDPNIGDIQRRFYRAVFLPEIEMFEPLD